MRVLLLGPFRRDLVEFIQSFDDFVVTTEEPLCAGSEYCYSSDAVISYGYRHILKYDFLKKFGYYAVNLHISLLPWNRGADPNLWSILEDTPKGVSIHNIDTGIDTGDILAQQKVGCLKEDTLRTSYERLSNTVENLFREIWPGIRSGKLKATPQVGEGSFHRISDREKVRHLLENGWDTPVSKLAGKFKTA
jgi:methionyl-tRNA formyltransferase